MTDILIAKRQPIAQTDAERDMFKRALFDAIDGVDDRNRKSWRRFWNWLVKAEVGEVFSITTLRPRSGPFHRLHMAMEQAVFDAQERFTDFEQFRVWLKVGAGHVDWIAGPKGAVIPVPRSISYARLDEDGMREFHEKVLTFLREPHALRVLWPHLDEAKREASMESVLSEFER